MANKTFKERLAYNYLPKTLFHSMVFFAAFTFPYLAGSLFAQYIDTNYCFTGEVITMDPSEFPDVIDRVHNIVGSQSVRHSGYISHDKVSVSITGVLDRCIEDDLAASIGDYILEN